MTILEEQISPEGTYTTPIQQKILDTLSSNGGILSRRQICKNLGYEYDIYTQMHKQRTTVYDNLLKLKNRGLVQKIRGTSTGKRGRPPEYWKIIT